MRNVAARIISIVVLLFCAFIWLAGFFRWSAIFYAVACFVVLPFLSSDRRPLAIRALWIGFLVCTLLPADISFRVRTGPPRFVRVAYGYPGAGLLEKEERGDVVWGGCVVSIYDPLWVIVW